MEKYLLHPAFRSFKFRVEGFINSVNLDDKNREDIVHEIVKLVMQIQEGMGSNTLRRKTFRLDILDDFTLFKNQYLDMSFHVHRRLWKAVIKAVNEGIFPEVENKALKEDVDFCIEHLNAADLKRVQGLSVNEHLNVDSIDIDKFETGEKKRKDLTTNSKSKVHSLRFLCDYDSSFELHDFVQDLTVESVRVINSYGRSRGKKLEGENGNVQLRVEKYVETALNNKVMNIKEFHTCENRRRVTTTHAPLYKERTKLKKLIKENPGKVELPDRLKDVEKALKNTESDYYSVVTPLVKSEDGEDRVIEVADTREDDICKTVNKEFTINTHKGVEDSMFLEDIILGLPQRFSTFVKIIIGFSVPEFETWASKEGINITNPDSLSKGAKKFCKVTTQELRSHPVLREALAR